MKFFAHFLTTIIVMSGKSKSCSHVKLTLFFHRPSLIGAASLSAASAVCYEHGIPCNYPSDCCSGVCFPYMNSLHAPGYGGECAGNGVDPRGK